METPGGVGCHGGMAFVAPRSPVAGMETGDHLTGKIEGGRRFPYRRRIAGCNLGEGLSPLWKAATT